MSPLNVTPLCYVHHTGSRLRPILVPRGRTHGLVPRTDGFPGRGGEDPGNHRGFHICEPKPDRRSVVAGKSVSVLVVDSSMRSLKLNTLIIIKLYHYIFTII